MDNIHQPSPERWEERGSKDLVSIVSRLSQPYGCGEPSQSIPSADCISTLPPDILLTQDQTLSSSNLCESSFAKRAHLNLPSSSCHNRCSLSNQPTKRLTPPTSRRFRPRPS